MTIAAPSLTCVRQNRKDGKISVFREILETYKTVGKSADTLCF